MKSARIVGRLIAFSFLFLTLSARSQTSFDYAAPTDGAGSANAETGRSICSDAAGNIYTIGTFNGTSTDFDLGPGTSTYSSSSTNDGYIVSYDKNGNFRWKTIIASGGNDFSQPGLGIATDGISVWFVGHINSGSSPVIANPILTTAIPITAGGGGTNDILLGKLDCVTGIEVWLRVFGGTGNNDLGTALAIDPSGNSYIVGAYSSTFTYSSVTFPTPAGASDVFVAKFDASGTIQWVSTGGGSGADQIANGAGIAYVPGTTPMLVVGASFSGAGSFGGFLLANAGGHDMLVLEIIASTGVVTNAIAAGTATTDEFMSAVYDPVSKDVILGGYFGSTGGGSISLPGFTTINLTSAGASDIVIGRYSMTNHYFSWAKSAGGTAADRLNSMAGDGLGGIHITGTSQSNPCTFHSGFSVNAGSGLDDIIVAKYDYNGNTLYALTAGSTASGSDAGRGITSYRQTSPAVKYVFLTGNFQNTITFGARPALVGDGGNDFFVARVVDGTAVLPLRILDFSGRRTDNETVLLQWDIDNATSDIRSFTIERSNDGTNFTTIGTRTASVNNNHYSYNDRPVYGTVYYRLRVDNNDGRFTYSNVLRIGAADGTEPVSLFPNPVASSFQLHVPASLVQTQAVLTTSTGTVVRTWKLTAANMTIDATTLAGGVYYIKLQDGSTVRFVKNK